MCVIDPSPNVFHVAAVYKTQQPVVPPTDTVVSCKVMGKGVGYGKGKCVEARAGVTPSNPPTAKR